MMKRPEGFKGFAIMSVGEIISLTGSAMTDFGIGIWIWRKTGDATPFSILMTFFFVANLLFSPIAGVFVDKWKRKKSLILPDLASAIVTFLMLVLYLSGKLSLPFIYVASFVSGAFNGLQWPAYSVTISSMLRKEEYGKANGLFSMTQSGPTLIAPALAGLLLPLIKLSGVMVVDLLTFAAAFGAVLWVKIPENKHTGKVAGIKSMLRDSLFGFKYIYKVKPLLLLLILFLAVNFFVNLWMPLLSPMILSKFNNSSIILGIVQSAFGAAGVAGGILMTVWGGAKKKTISLFGGIIISAFGILLLGVAKTVCFVIFSLVIVAVSGVVANSSNQAIWQKIIPVEIQGRVFSAKKFMSQSVALIPMALSGPFVDKYLAEKVKNFPFLVSLFGTGKGGAISLLVSFSGIAVMIVGLIAILSPALMNIENIRPENFQSEKG